MNIKKLTKEELSWDIDLCEATALIDNGVLMNFSIKQKGAILSGTSGIQVEIPNEDRVREIHKAMTELIQHLDQSRGFEQKRPVKIAAMSDDEINSMVEKGDLTRRF